MNLSAINNITSNTTKTTGVSPFMELELEKIYPNPNQPRKTFNDIDELALSIETNGLIQPIAVVFDGLKYMIISGERRYKACLLLELKTIKALIVKANSKKIEELSPIENIQRNDLTDFEIAKFVGKLWNSGQYKLKKDLAKAIGKKDTYVSKVFSVLKIDDHIKKDIEANTNDIPLSVLEEISRIDKSIQGLAYTQYINGHIKRDGIKTYAKEYKAKIQPLPNKSFKLHEQFKTTGAILNKCFNDFEFDDDKNYTVIIKEV